MVNAQVL